MRVYVGVKNVIFKTTNHFLIVFGFSIVYQKACYSFEVFQFKTKNKKKRNIYILLKTNIFLSKRSIQTFKKSNVK